MFSKKKTLLLLALTSLLPISQAQAAETLDRIVAVVNDEVVLSSELDSAVENISRQLLAQNGQLPPRDILQEQVLDRLIVSRIQIAQAHRAGIRIDEAQLNDALQNIAQRNNMSLRDFAAKLQADGTDYPKFREEIRKELTIVKLRQQQVDRRIAVSEAELEDALQTLAAQDRAQQSWRLRHILVSLPEGADNEARAGKRAHLDEIITRLEGGMSFAEAAVAYSDGPNALEGGDLGWRSSTELPQLFAEAVINQGKGDTVGPLDSPNGFHLLFVEDVRGGEIAVSNETLARHILIRTNGPLDNDRSRRRAEDLRRRLSAGADFAQLAKENSDDPGSAAQGGDLGWAPAGVFVGPFEDAMNNLEANEISQPIKTQFGWHIIQVLDRRQTEANPDIRREQIRQAIAQRKLNEEMELWARRLRDEAYVDIRL